VSFARFQTEQEAQNYADAVQAELRKNRKYIAPRWSDVYTGTDGAFYVYANASVEAEETVSEIPSAVEES
jgi:aspartate/methionine/tyrosine aminotransferase